jgi:hypothetical protein
MRRVIAIVAAGASLAGCSSFPSLSMDAFKSTPPTQQIQLDSMPPGADARTSLGPGCKTPCSVAVTPPDSGFSVTYTLNKFQPATVFDPNPVVAELQPAGPPPKSIRKGASKPKKPKPPKGAAGGAGTPFPDPGAPPPR